MAFTESQLRDLHDKLDFILKDFRVLLKRTDQVVVLAKTIDKLQRRFETYKTTQSSNARRRNKRNDDIIRGVQKAVTALARSQTALARSLTEPTDDVLTAQRKDFYNSQRAK